MGRLETKRAQAEIRDRRVRNVITGTSERPRLAIKVTNKGFEAQIIDDSIGKTLLGMRKTASAANVKLAEEFGKEVATAAKKAKVKTVVLDRGHKRYHGRIKAFADAARENGLEF